MGCLTPQIYLTKPTTHLARPCQRGASAKADKVMRPYAAEGCQGAASSSLTAPFALWTAAEAVALCYLLLLRARAVDDVAVLWTLGRATAPHPPTARPRTRCTTCPCRFDCHSSHGCRRAQSTHTHAASHAAAAASSISHEVGAPFFVLSFRCLFFVAVFQIPSFLSHFITETIVLGTRKQFETRFRFGLANSLWVQNPTIIWSSANTLVKESWKSFPFLITALFTQAIPPPYPRVSA